MRLQHSGSEALSTPALLIDECRLDANIQRMNRHLKRLGVPLRPHLKTVKNLELARRMLAGHPGGATVSTLAEADYFHAAGISDLVYAVGIAPGKLAAVAARLQAGMRLTLLLDEPDTAEQVVRESERLGRAFRLLIEIDADGQRAGLRPDDPALIETARMLVEGGQDLAGVLVHAGGSYGCRDQACLEAMAERERMAAVTAGQILAGAGFPVPNLSVGSTPTALFARDLSGISEVRAGVYACMDLVMAGLGVCTMEQIAISVLTEVIGHRKATGELLVDAGWMALSRDRGTADQAVDQGYGLVCDVARRVLAEDLVVRATNQEHGIVARRDGQPLDPAGFPVGCRLRILPNHACATAAQFDTCWLLQGNEARELLRCRGW